MLEIKYEKNDKILAIFMHFCNNDIFLILRIFVGFLDSGLNISLENRQSDRKYLKKIFLKEILVKDFFSNLSEINEYV